MAQILPAAGAAPESKILAPSLSGLCADLPQAHHCGLNDQVAQPRSTQAAGRSGSSQTQVSFKADTKNLVAHHSRHLFPDFSIAGTYSMQPCKRTSKQT